MRQCRQDLLLSEYFIAILLPIPILEKLLFFAIYGVNPPASVASERATLGSYDGIKVCNAVNQLLEDQGIYGLCGFAYIFRANFTDKSYDSD